MSGGARLLWVSILVFLLGGNPIAAATAVLRGGEHEGFTRLAFTSGRLLVWTAETVEGGIEIAFDPGLPALDTAATFSRIARARLTGLTVRGDTLRLDLGCDCGIRIFTDGGIVAIDIGEALPKPGERVVAAAPQVAPPPTARILPLVLPRADLAPLPHLSGFDDRGVDPQGAEQPPPAEPTEPRRPVAADTPDPVPAEAETAGPGLQIAIRRGPVAPPAPPPGGGPAFRTALASGCEFEGRALEILRNDPQAALDDLRGATARLHDDGGAPSREGAAAVAEAYLRAGWGAEARQIMAAVPGAEDPTLARLALLLDDVPGTDLPDASCGPASALLAIRAGAAEGAIARTEIDVLAAFVADLPPARRSHLLPALIRAAQEAGEDRLAGLLRDTTGPAPDTAGDPSHADEGAVHAVIAALDAPAPSSLMLENALALRPSLPEGSDRDRLDRLLARRLIEGGHVATALPLFADGGADADAGLSLALDVLPEGQAAEAAMRLLPHATRGGAAAIRAAHLFESRGLEETARLFRTDQRLGTGGPDLPRVADRPHDPWLARDLVHVAEDGVRDGASPRQHLRGRLAETILSRNGLPGGGEPANRVTPDAPAGDIARGERELIDSRALRDILGDLLTEPDAS